MLNQERTVTNLVCSVSRNTLLPRPFDASNEFITAKPRTEFASVPSESLSVAKSYPCMSSRDKKNALSHSVYNSWASFHPHFLPPDGALRTKHSNFALSFELSPSPGVGRENFPSLVYAL